MKFYNIDINLDPKITGRRNGSFAVEIKKNSFEKDEHKEYFNSFFDSNSNDIKGVRIETFQQFDLKKCPSVIYFPMTKSIKKLDFMYYAPYELGIDFLISEKVVDIISAYKLPIHNKIPVKIDTFDEKYLVVPEPVLVTSMKEHQRYFVVYNQEKQLLPFFVSVRNGNDYMIENVAKGNQKVLTARLEDALFFYEEDLKIPMTTFLKKLETLNFHAKIGSMTEKMDRVQLLVGRLAKELNLPSDVVVTAQRAASIYKFDLVTNMVGEFPELQGIMGEIYALKQGETQEVAQAIREHYMPTSADGELPSSVPGALLAVADKLDTFLSFTAAGMLPTGSNDPYALRRQVMGLVQILAAFDWNIEIEDFTKLLLGLDYAEFLSGKEEEVEEFILSFIRERVAQRIATITKRHDIIDAIVNSHTSSVPEQLKAAKVLSAVSESEEFKGITEALNRVINISAKAQDDASGEILEDRLETESERTLVKAIKELHSKVQTLTPEELYSHLEAMAPKINDFFNENMVMVDDEATRRNRLRFLGLLSEIILDLADFTSLIVK